MTENIIVYASESTARIKFLMFDVINGCSRRCVNLIKLLLFLEKLHDVEVKIAKLIMHSIRGVIKNYVDFSHNLITVQANIFKFQLTINLFKSNQFGKFGSLEWFYCH